MKKIEAKRLPRNRRGRSQLSGIFYIFILLLFLPFGEGRWGFIYSQSGWVLQSPIPTNQFILSVFFANNNTGYACGEGIILKTTNFGLNWSNSLVSNEFLSSISFINPNTGYICGWSGDLYKTSDGGLNWSNLYSISSTQLRAVCFIDQNTGFLGGNYIALKTTNGGITWDSININSGTIYSINFINSNTGFMGGRGGFYNGSVIWKTTDAGNNWLYIDMSNYSWYVSSISFADSLNGYASGYGNSSSSYIFRTTDGGNYWLPIQLPYYTSQTRSISFINANTGYLIARTNYSLHTILKTTNAAADWNTNLQDCNIELYSISAPDSNHAISVGYAQIVETSNSGLNWQYSSSSSCFYNSLFFINQLTGFAVGNTLISGAGSSVSKTTNGGINWITSQDCITYGNFYSVTFPTVSIGYAIGMDYAEHNIIIKTTDCGQSWFNQVSPLSGIYYLTSVCFLNQDTGFICGYQTGTGYFLKTINGGQNWQLINPGINFNNTILFSVYFTNPMTGYISVGYGFDTDSGIVFKTSDQGNNWIPLNTGIIPALISISFINENTGYILSNGNEVIKTTNAGNNWISLTIPTDGMNSIFFINEQTGYITGNGIYKTLDGGNNWEQQSNPSNVTLNSVYFVNDSIGWAAGGGTIIKTTTGGNPIGIKKIIQNEPESFKLFQNYPNPFNPSTIINYQLPITNYVKLVVYNILGQELKTLVNEKQSAGSYRVIFDGSKFASGIYFYSLIVNDKLIQSKKMVLIK